MNWRFDSDLQTWEIRGKACMIWMQARPAYCDRGNWLAHIEPQGSMKERQELSLDDQDGWPRYYFDLERAKAEIEAWLRKRGQALD